MSGVLVISLFINQWVTLTLHYPAVFVSLLFYLITSIIVIVIVITVIVILDVLMSTVVVLVLVVLVVLSCSGTLCIPKNKRNNNSKTKHSNDHTNNDISFFVTHFSGILFGGGHNAFGSSKRLSDVTMPLTLPLPKLSVVVVVVVAVSDVFAESDSDDSVDTSLFSSLTSTINKDGNCFVRLPSLTVKGEPAIHTKSIQYRSTPLSGKLWPLSS
eukprot:CAMPEP_0170853352 /NCGR_PEP_ID=MMETSP0734-20130129/12463_1 /TAXON_ID=186038 /ORGANISM="Fragilariopsis kerguelensis, Strain L26-C5" /LENGTH=213 /DNA_ID=CAMNT_0011224017 /DNA_START=214 /DNA_END=859 /DNA_ORIENTATION=-